MKNKERMDINLMEWWNECPELREGRLGIEKEKQDQRISNKLL